MLRDVSSRTPLAVSAAVLAAGLLLTFGAASDQLPSPQGSSAIAFDSTEFNFGTIYHGETASHTFTFRNTGTARLLIGAAYSTCGCAVTRCSAEEVEPGGAGTIEVVFDSAGLVGPVRKYVWVLSNDPAHQNAELTVAGEVKCEAQAVPGGVYFGRLPYREAVERTVVITPRGVPSARVMGAETADPALQVAALRPAGRSEPAGSCTLTVRIGPFSKPGPFTSRVIVHTALPHQRQVVIPVYGSATDTRVPVPEGISLVDLETAKGIVEAKSAPVLDARSPDEYAAGHIPGAVSLPAAAFEKRFPALASTISAAPEILIYCEDDGCRDAVRLAERLREAYRGRILLLERGWPRWAEAGYAVTRNGRP